MKSRRTRSAYKCRVCQDDVGLVGEDVELDDVAVAVPVDDLGVCRQRNVTAKMKGNKSLHEEPEVFESSRGAI